MVVKFAYRNDWTELNLLQHMFLEHQKKQLKIREQIRPVYCTGVCFFRVTSVYSDAAFS